MSISCVGTCSHCGVKRFWLSDTLSLQLDDGTLECLPHPGERWACEKHGLTLVHASERGRLYRESFYVCRTCGREGETIERTFARDWGRVTVSVRGAMTWGWGTASIVIPFFIWMRWWEALFVIGGTLLASPGIYWWENRKQDRARPGPKLPTPDAPGSLPIAEPVTGCIDETEMIVGRSVKVSGGQSAATGPCCDKPDWVCAALIKDEYGVPCCACGKGVMVVSEHSIH